jgi:transposase
MRRSTGSATGRRAKRTFSAEFKREAVELMRRRRTEGVSLSQVARELDIGAGLLWEWARKLEGGGDAAPARSPGETLEEENRRLRRENALLREEREFAKKALVFFARESP